MRPVRLSLTILLAATASCSLPQQPRSSQSHTQGSSGGGGGSSGSSSKEPNTDIEAEIRNALTVAGWAGLGTFLLGLPGVLIRGSRTSSRGGAQHSLAQKPNLVDSLALQSQQSQSPPPGPPPFDVSPLRSLSTSQLRRKLERLRQKTEASGKESGIRACRKQMVSVLGRESPAIRPPVSVLHFLHSRYQAVEGEIQVVEEGGGTKQTTDLERTNPPGP